MLGLPRQGSALSTKPGTEAANPTTMDSSAAPGVADWPGIKQLTPEDPTAFIERQTKAEKLEWKAHAAEVRPLEAGLGGMWVSESEGSCAAPRPDVAFRSSCGGVGGDGKVVGKQG